jgi:hypothetical protein
LFVEEHNIFWWQRWDRLKKIDLKIIEDPGGKEEKEAFYQELHFSDPHSREKMIQLTAVTKRMKTGPIFFL